MTSTDCSPARSGSLQEDTQREDYEAVGEMHRQRTSPVARTLFNRDVAEGGPRRPQGLGEALPLGL